MICPECARTYERREFGRDETYFECDDCGSELALSPQERAAEYLRNGVPETTTATVPPEASAEKGPSTTPLKVWTGLLILFGTIRICAGLAEAGTGDVGRGVFLVGFYVVLFGPTIAGLVRRRRYGLYLSYGIIVLLLLSTPGSLLRGQYRSLAEFLGATTGSLMFAITAVWIFSWLYRNRALFAPERRQTGLVADVYSPSAPPTDV